MKYSLHHPLLCYFSFVLSIFFGFCHCNCCFCSCNASFCFSYKKKKIGGWTIFVKGRSWRSVFHGDDTFPGTAAHSLLGNYMRPRPDQTAMLFNIFIFAGISQIAVFPPRSSPCWMSPLAFMLTWLRRLRSSGPRGWMDMWGEPMFFIKVLLMHRRPRKRTPASSKQRTFNLNKKSDCDLRCWMTVSRFSSFSAWCWSSLPSWPWPSRTSTTTR